MKTQVWESKSMKVTVVFTPFGCVHRLQVQVHTIHVVLKRREEASAVSCDLSLDNHCVSDLTFLHHFCTDGSKSWLTVTQQTWLSVGGGIFGAFIHAKFERFCYCH